MESRLSDRKLKPLPPDPFRHQDSAIAPQNCVYGTAELGEDAIACCVRYAAPVVCDELV